MQRRQFLHTLGASALLGTSLAAQAQISDLNDAINKAGRLRMLSQRMSKCWLAMALDVETVLAGQTLDKSQTQFKKLLADLRGYASTPELKDTYAKLDAAWHDFDGLLDSKSGKSGAAGLLQLDAKVLALSHQGTQQYEAALGRPTGQLVNLAGRQRMLTQRIAKFYLAAQIPVDPAGAQQEIIKARTEFIASMEVLRNAPEATPRIKDELKLAEGQWLFFDSAMRRSSTNPGQLMADVFVTSENLLGSMDTVTGLYAALKA